MVMSIMTNTAALGAQRNLANTQKMLAKSVARLSSGLRINRAGDDAAGLGISENLKADIRSLAQARRNSSDAVSMTQTAEGALNEIHGIVTRMREISVQAANQTLGSTERGYIQTEFAALREEIDRISNVTEFNGQMLINGDLGTAGASFQVGIHGNAASRISLVMATTNASALSLDAISLATAGDAQTALASFDNAITALSTRRAGIGATQNRLEATIQNLSVTEENMQAAHSRIRDVDVASESSALTRAQILTQAGTSVLAQANQLPQSVLQLIGN